MDATPLKFDSNSYIETRLKQYQKWYDGKAVKYKKRYLAMRAFAVVAGGIVPVMVNVESALDTWIRLPITRGLLTLISLLVVISVSLESVFHYREQWKNYRSTEQMLGHELCAFMSRINAYQELTEDGAFRLLVERVEGLIAAENAATLSVLTSGSETGQIPTNDRH